MSLPVSTVAPFAANQISKPLRMAALISHPIQYIVPLLRRLSERPEIDLTVYFMTDTGLKAGFIKGYGETLKWDLPLLDGYAHSFLPNRSPWPNSNRPTARVNPGIVRELASGRFDALFMHSYATVTDWLGYSAAKALRIPVLFWGDVLVDSPKRNVHSDQLRTLLRRGFSAGIDAALAMSTQARRFYEVYDVPKDRVYWAPLCVDVESWSTKVGALRPTKEVLRAEVGVDPDLPAIAYVAHMRPNKRPKDVALALERMTVPASLIMAGSGPMFDDLKAECERRRIPRVHLLGLQNQSQLPRVYAMSDVFVLPSGPGEVTPLVIQEAMAASLPLVISDAVPSIVDFVREGENGFTYPVGDIDCLAKRLDQILADPTTAAHMGQRSRELITRWNYDETVAGILSALHDVARIPG